MISSASVFLYTVEVPILNMHAILATGRKATRSQPNNHQVIEYASRKIVGTVLWRGQHIVSVVKQYFIIRIEAS